MERDNATSVSRNPLGWVDDALDELERAGLRRRLAVRGGAQTGRVEIDGRELTNFGSNDYLGIEADARLIEAARREGLDSSSTPVEPCRSTRGA